jgi:hypothetical protein
MSAVNRQQVIPLNFVINPVKPAFLEDLQQTIIL